VQTFIKKLSISNNHRLILVSLFGICSLIYYFGELVDFAGWTALQWQFLYDVHDIQRLLFFAPIMYACYFFGFKVMASVTAASLIVFLPRAILITDHPDAVIRSVLFVTVAFAMCWFIRKTRHVTQVYSGSEAVTGNQNPGQTGITNKTQDEMFITGDLKVNLSKRLIRKNGQIVKLTPTEYNLLVYLFRNSGRVLTHNELVCNVWGPQYGQESEYLHTFIWQLRRKIENDPSNPKFIVTKRGVGYYFAEAE
jgi:DNA-binding winged helix-turn-helix (wHTH) protein